MTAAKRITWGPAAVVLVCLIVLVFNWRHLEATHAVEQAAALDNPDIPPTIALTTQAVGPLRGLISNGLWWRAVRLQDEGNFFEAIQLANWISSLQPKLTRVWTYQSWNMAYNITVEIDDREERWRWILQSISLLRDKGLRYNPRDAIISTEIGQTIMQKIGNDPHHSRYYQLQWAKIMSQYLATGRRPELEALAAAPETTAALRAQPGVGDLLDQAEAAGLDLFDRNTYHLTPAQIKELTAPARVLLQDEDNAAALDAIRDFVMKRDLRREQRLDPAWMLALDRKYGPFDWRLYHAHVVYWCASESFELWEGKEGYQHAYVRQAMVQSFYDGRLLYFDDKGLSTAPNLDIIENTHHYLADHLNNQPYDKGALSLNRQFHEWAILLLYTNMYEEAAEDVFEDYTHHFMVADERRKWTFESFIETKAPELLQATARGRRDAAIVKSSLVQAYYWAGRGDDYRAKGYENLARLMWRRNQKAYAATPDRRLPPWDELRKEVLTALVSDNSPMPPDVKAKLQALTGDADLMEIRPSGPRRALDLKHFIEAHDHR